jgi:hypothetical protein
VGHQRVWYNSCADRHCPKCQSLARAQWIQDRQCELLDVPYFHTVFTVPQEIADIALQNKRTVYGHSLPRHRRHAAHRSPAAN